MIKVELHKMLEIIRTLYYIILGLDLDGEIMDQIDDTNKMIIRKLRKEDK